MTKKNKCIIKLLLLLTVMYAPIVKADLSDYVVDTEGQFDVTADYVTSTNTGIFFSTMTQNADGSYNIGAGTEYSSPIINMQRGSDTDAKYETHCVDPGATMASTNLTCTPFNSQKWNYVYQATKGIDADVRTLVYRMTSMSSGVSANTGNTDKNAITAYYQLKRYGTSYYYNKYIQDFIDAGICTTESCPDAESLADKIVAGSSADGLAKIEQALQIATDASQYWKSDEYDLSDTNQGAIKFTKESEDGQTVTYKVSSLKPMDNVKFEVFGASVAYQWWYDKSGTVKITVPEGSCNFTIEAKYPATGLYKCGTNGDTHTQTLITYLDDVSAESAQVYEGSISGVEACGGCCPDEPIEAGTIFGDVNNCCYEDTHSYAKDYDLNQLFCDDELRKVKKFRGKCNIDYYKKGEDTLNRFCEMYCVERADIYLPGATTASSGRYFQLALNEKTGKSSPYIIGKKYCRVLIHFDDWIKRYAGMVDSEEKYFNEFQKAAAIHETYKDAFEAPIATKATGEIECSINIDTTLCSGDDEFDFEYRDTETLRFPSNVYVDKFIIKDFHEYVQVKQGNWYNKVERDKDGSAYEKILTEANKYKSDSNTKSQICLATLGNDSCRYNPPSEITVYSQEDIGELEQAISNVISRDKPDPFEYEYTCGDDSNVRTLRRSYTCKSSHNFIFVTDVNEDRLLQNAETKRTENEQGYNSAVKNAKNYEKQLDTCVHYFTKYAGSNPNSFEFNPSVAFSYSQSYLDETGELKSDTIPVPFLPTPGCTKTVAESGVEYSGIYSKENKDHKIMNVTDMANIPIQYIDPKAQGISDPEAYIKGNYLDEQYDADKRFVVDGTYTADCKWDEGENKIFTLAQSGMAVDRTSEINYTIHERQYQIYLTTLEGRYETFWDISGVGTAGYFDNFLLKNQYTCAGEPAKDVAMFTCAVEVEHEVVLTGYCNGNGAYDVNNGTNFCDPFKEGYELVNFKVVDPSDLFPSVSGSDTPMYEGRAYAHNWIKDPEGQAVLGKIETDGAKDKTYAPERLSYSFTLSPSDMQHIKAYNESRIPLGGYTDFELTCDCPDYSLPLNSTESCKRCKSTFIENLSNGKIKIGSSTSTVTGWSNKKENLGSVRNGNHW